MGHGESNSRREMEGPGIPTSKAGHVGEGPARAGRTGNGS
jgi:hypothetical protein